MSEQQTIEEMREALAAFEREGVVECRHHTAHYLPWVKTETPAWDFVSTEYRPCPPKPAAPRKPREYWINDYGDDLWYRHNTAPMAKSCLRPGGETLHVREVLLPDEPQPDEPQPVDRTPWTRAGSQVFAGTSFVGNAASLREAERVMFAHNCAIGLSSEEGEA